MRVGYIKPAAATMQGLAKIDVPDLTMPIDRYSEWLTAIIDDDVVYMTNTVSNLSKSDKHRHFNGHFTTEDRETERIFHIHFKKHSRIHCQKPLILAFIYGSKKVMAAMLEHGADPLAKESNLDTILHNVASVANSYPETEPELAEMYGYFMDLLSKKQQKELLYSENELGLRPLEDAAHKGCSLLVKSIFQTPGLYLAKEKAYGMWIYQWYDITDYECFGETSRRGKSPLAFIGFISNKSAHCDNTKKLLYWNPFYHWYRIKLLANTPWLVLWGLCRFAFSLLVMVIMVEKSNLMKQGGIPEDEAELYPNATFYYCSGYTIIYLSPGRLKAAAIFTCVCATLGLAYDVGELAYVLTSGRPAFLRIQLRRGDTAISFWFHRVSQTLFLSAVLLFAAKIAINRPISVDVVSDIGRLFIIITAFASLLFFLEQLPQIGFYIIAIKRMLKDSSTSGCVVDFSDYLRSFYSMFLIMLNMLNLETIQVKNAFVLYMTHMVFIFVVSILLVNFLIAVMTDSAIRISMQKKTLLRLEKLHTVFIVESRLCWILKSYYRFMIRRMAIEQDDRIYLLNIEQIAKKK
ncbi:hypothetical protein LSH36_1030g00020 [Paralvinella palmiformis]|uniref:Ion transport domain-containing protein n=1 Tax=Paralvinella palmiformis TaxID=53620 RepID=A0AAD9MRW1_9ANNE|nr:hypothetical protein LSH36_1030g00020 [Paralvinella palmiformis]